MEKDKAAEVQSSRVLGSNSGADPTKANQPPAAWQPLETVTSWNYQDQVHTHPCEPYTRTRMLAPRARTYAHARPRTHAHTQAVWGDQCGVSAEQSPIVIDKRNVHLVRCSGLSSHSSVVESSLHS